MAAWVSAAFGAGTQFKPTPTVNAPTNTVGAVATYNSGVALVHEKKYSEALVDFQKAVAAKPDFAEAHNTWRTVSGLKVRRDTMRHWLTTIRRFS
jgi:TolA-binding protein